MPARPLPLLAAVAIALTLAGPAFASGAPAPAPSPELAATTALAQPPAGVDAAPWVAPRSNEAMEFQVTYLGMTMGKVRLFAGKVDPSVAPIFLQAQTTSIFAIVTLRQQLASYLDVATGLPRSGSLDAVEGSYKHTDTVRYDRDANKATIREKGKYDNTYLIDVPPDAMDFVALVYRLRTLPLEPGARYIFRVLSGRDLSMVPAEVLGRERIETKAGTFQAVKVRVPTGFTGKFSEKSPTFVWFSDDDRHLVVRISADFAIGRAIANLTSYTPGAAPVEASAAPTASPAGTALATP